MWIRSECGEKKKKSSRKAVHRNCAMHITEGKHHFQTAGGLVQKSTQITFCHHISRREYPVEERKRSSIIDFFQLTLGCQWIPAHVHRHSHTLRLLAPPFDQLLLCHHYLDSIRLQKPPEAYFIQGSRVRHSTIPNDGISQCKNLPFVAGVCQGFSVSRWRSNRRKSTLVWSWENKRASGKKTGLNSHSSKNKNSSYVMCIIPWAKESKSVNMPHLCYLWLNIWHKERRKAFVFLVFHWIKALELVANSGLLMTQHFIWPTDNSWGLSFPG